MVQVRKCSRRCKGIHNMPDQPSDSDLLSAVVKTSIADSLRYAVETVQQEAMQLPLVSVPTNLIPFHPEPCEVCGKTWYTCTVDVVLIPEKDVADAGRVIHKPCDPQNEFQDHPSPLVLPGTPGSATNNLTNRIPHG